MTLELINVFNRPFVHKPSETIIADHVNAVGFIVNYENDCTAFSNYVEDELKKQQKHSSWQKVFKLYVPSGLAKYKKNYKNCNKAQADIEIKSLGITLAPKQILYHGGVLNISSGGSISEPLSTTFNPLVALTEAKDRGKAYNAGVVHVNVLKIVNEQLKIYPYKPQNKLGHEYEVLLGSGATLTKTKETKVCNNYPVCTYCDGTMPQKDVEVYVIEWEVS